MKNLKANNQGWQGQPAGGTMTVPPLRPAGLVVAGGMHVPGQKPQAGVGGGLAWKIERSIIFMEENCHRQIPVAALASQVSVSPSHFFALFKRMTGCPPMAYFTRIKMRRACQMFGSTPASVKEVAAALGYDDPLHFSRVFKSVCKVAPSRFRVMQSDARLCTVPAIGGGSV